MEQLQPQTPEAPAAPVPELTLAQRLERQLAREAGEEWHPPQPEPPAAEAAPETPAEGEQPAEAAPAGDTPPEPEAAPQFAEVEIDGKVYQVPPELKDGYLRQSDYTKKTQTLAEDRKAAEALKQAAERAYQVVNQMAPAVAAWQQAVSANEQYNKLDWMTLRSQDLTQYNTLRLEAQENFARMQALAQQLQQAPQAIEALQAQSNAEIKAREMPKALEKVPDLKQRESELISAGDAYGFSENEIRSVLDHRVIVALRDLAEYRKIVAQKAAIPSKVAQVAPVSKPGARGQPQAATTAKDYQAALKKLSNNGYGPGSDDAFIEALRAQRKLQGN